MREVRVYSDQPLSAETTLRLSSGAARHVSQALRMKAGQPLTLFDGRGGEFAAIIDSVSRTAVQVTTGAHQDIERESPLDITLWHGLCRAERMDTVVQKATELGVTRIQPMLTERSLIKLDSKRAIKKTQHWHNIAISACEQCGRNRIPTICAPARFADLLSTVTDYPAALLLHPSGETGLATAATGCMAPLLCTGPEGGFSDSEVAAAVDAGFRAVTLGPRIFRTETAPLAALAVMQMREGDLG